jgi:aminodeoxyfutalosine synthase
MMRKQSNMLEQLVGDSQALDRALAGEELSYKDGLELMNYDNLKTGW